MRMDSPGRSEVWTPTHHTHTNRAMNTCQKLAPAAPKSAALNGGILTFSAAETYHSLSFQRRCTGDVYGTAASHGGGAKQRGGPE